MKIFINSTIIASALLTGATVVAHAGSFSAWGHEFTTNEAASQQFETSRSGPVTFNAVSETGRHAHRRTIPAEQVFGPR